MLENMLYIISILERCDNLISALSDENKQPFISTRHISNVFIRADFKLAILKQ